MANKNKSTSEDQGQIPTGTQNLEHQPQVTFGALMLDPTANLVASWPGMAW